MDDATNLVEAPEVEELPVDGGQADTTELDEFGNPIEPEDAEDGALTADPEPDDDSEEIERAGQKYRIPKALKGEFLMHADYTQKTQALAADRQALDAAREQFQQISRDELNAHANVLAIDQELAEYKQIDWRQWFHDDPQAAQAARLEFDDAKDRRQQAVNTFSQAQSARQELEQARQVQAQRDAAKQAYDSHAELKRDIPGWDQDKATALLNFGQKQFGFSRQELDSIKDPKFIKVLHAAWEGDKAKAQQKTVKQIEAKQAVKPAAKVGGGSSPPSSLDDRNSAEAWIKQRNKQIANRQR